MNKNKKILLLLGGVVFMIAGAYRGELGLIFSKAINICLECIGLG